MHFSSAEVPDFFGRKSVLELIAKRTDAFVNGYRQNLAILGVPKVGKTAVICSSIDRFRSLGLVPIFFSCLQDESFDRFCDRWMAQILIGFHFLEGNDERPTFANLLKAVRPRIPNTVRQMKRVKKSVLARKYDQAFRDMMRLTETAQRESGKKIVMVIEDFDRISDLKINNAFSVFGHEMMTQKETLFVVTSSRLKSARAILQNELCLLFGNFETIDLKTFGYDEAVEFIDQQLQGRQIDPLLKRFLIRLTDAHPFYLKTILGSLRSGFSPENQSGDSRPDSLPRENVFRILSEELCDERGLLYHYFESRLFLTGNGFSWAYAGDLMAAVASGHQKYSQIVRFLRRPTAEVKKIIQKLTANEMLNKHGSILSIPDSLFRFWLKAVYFYHRFSYALSDGDRRKIFLDHLERQFEAEDAADRSEMPARIVELFREFGNDAVDFGEGRRLILPHFSEVLSKPNNGRVFPVVARSGKTRWMCQIVAQRVGENDVVTFQDDLKRLRCPVQKRIIVGLRGIDLNAKLLAQEAKIKYFDLRQFNFLLDLYGKPKIFM